MQEGIIKKATGPFKYIRDKTDCKIKNESRVEHTKTNIQGEG